MFAVSCKRDSKSIYFVLGIDEVVVEMMIRSVGKNETLAPWVSRNYI